MNEDELAIRTAVERWAVWRDAGYWDRFATVWHPDGVMSATWFHGSATDFIAASRRGFDAGVRILHFLGGTTVDVAGDHAISETKMTITQRAELHGTDVDVVCTGRFYDFWAKVDAAWLLVRRQPIYEIDRVHVLDPSASLVLDADRLARFPVGYRHLGYLQDNLGMEVRLGLPGLTGDAVAELYADGATWLEDRQTR